MSNIKWIVSMTMLSLVIVFLLFARYLDYSGLHNEWIVVYPGQDTVFIEYRVQLLDLREVISEGNLTLEQAVLLKLNAELSGHPRNPSDCFIEDILGDLHTGILLQARCNEFEAG